MNVIVLDAHPPRDVRIGRHIGYLLDQGAAVSHLNYNLFSPRSAHAGRFSDVGENGLRFDLYDQFRRHSGINRRVENARFLLGRDMARQAAAGLESLGQCSQEFTVVHVHDPILLPLAAHLAESHLPMARLIYDRHELYEESRSFHGINVSTIFERLCRRRIHGVAVVSDQHRAVTEKLFPGARIAAVPNYPSIKDYDEAAINRKVESFSDQSDICVNYIGSLDNAFDRDVDLMIELARRVMMSNRKARFLFGGMADQFIAERLNALAAEFTGRFHYPGYIPYSTTVKMTTQAQIGLLLIKPDTCYWVRTSPNKIFEYLICGVVPVIRADVDNSDQIKECSLLFGREASEGEIIEGTLDLINDPARLRRMMRKAREVSRLFTFEMVAHRYLELYARDGS